MCKWLELLDRLGIAKSYTDAAQNHKQYVIDDEILLNIINNLGYKIKSIDEAEKLLEKLDKQRWLYMLDPIYVVRKNDIYFDVVLPKNEKDEFSFAIKKQDTNEFIEVSDKEEFLKEKTIGKKDYIFIRVKIEDELEPQYYEIEFEINKEHRHTILAVTPDKCYEAGVLNKDKLWGFASQLYSLKSRRNWGVGDFTDLYNFVSLCKRVGANVIGLNPLNVLVHNYPENASPYSSISRLFLNPIYIDVEKVDGFKKEDITDKKDIIESLRNSKDIDYTSVYNLKIEVLKKAFDRFVSEGNMNEYNEFCLKKGTELDNLATYQVLCSYFKDNVGCYLKSWPKEFQNPYSSAVKDFKKEHSNEIEFFKYLQYCAFKQQAEVSKHISEVNLELGLYRDLPVGLSKDSVELWEGNDFFIKDCGAGAPPDIFFPTGQKWCLGAFNPYKLKDNAYLPFIKILRSAMQGAGAIRIDHVMSLMRLYIIPDCEDSGTYVYYNFDDMLGIVALESYLNKCMVVGESIGNVPDGFIEKIHDRGLYSLSVLWAERWCCGGDFKYPCDFPERAFCSVGTHDMPPLKMKWFGYDIELMHKLKMLNDEERINMYKDRECERRCLLKALDNSSSWSWDNVRQADCIYGEGYPNGLTEAVQRFVSSSKSKVYLAQLEDILEVEELQNLPGTDIDKHPNWHRKIPVYLEDLETNENFVRAMKAINK